MDISLILKQLDGMRHVSKNGTEFWRAREIQTVLGYQEWRNFDVVLGKAKMACTSSGFDSSHHFVETNKMVTIGSGAARRMIDYFLSRYACYLIAMNGDPDKPEIGAAQSYFAVQTRRQEIADQLTYDEKRLTLRERVKNANRYLAGAAKKAGVHNFPAFQDAGYKGLYGMGAQEIKETKSIPDKHNLLDYAGRVELAANEFRITQTEERLKRDVVTSQIPASNTHREVGREVREAIRRVGGTMPENLPAEEPIKKVEARVKKRLPKPSK